MNIHKIKIQPASCGSNVTIYEPSNVYGCNIADDVFIGPFVEIQSKVNIGHSTPIQSHSFICELVNIGANCFIGNGVNFINDTFSHGTPARGDKSLWKRTDIEDNVYIGSNSTILPIKICSGTVIGAGSVVVKSIDVPGIYAGNPARLIRKH